jgi:methyltransferase (TIGR00027 family)
MQFGQPSRTALAAAVHRAVHQVLENGAIFTDPLAMRMVAPHGEDAEALVRDAEQNPQRRAMRIFIAARTRLAEDALASAVAGGTGQLVVLGAGLDTYAYRGAIRDRLRIFEVDHPATQAWKRQRLAETAIPLPPALTFVPVDFERETLGEGLTAAGFDTAQRAFFTWLGGVPYLTEEAAFSTLCFIGSVPGGAEVVFDYSNPPDSLSPEMRAEHDVRAARVAGIGEAWVSYFESGGLRSRLTTLGFSEIEDLGPPQIAAHYFPQRAGSAPDKGGHMVRARTF